jgi:hypothetical protein
MIMILLYLLSHLTFNPVYKKKSYYSVAFCPSPGVFAIPPVEKRGGEERRRAAREEGERKRLKMSAFKTQASKRNILLVARL